MHCLQTFYTFLFENYTDGAKCETVPPGLSPLDILHVALSKLYIYNKSLFKTFQETL